MEAFEASLLLDDLPGLRRLAGRGQLRRDDEREATAQRKDLHIGTNGVRNRTSSGRDRETRLTGTAGEKNDMKRVCVRCVEWSLFTRNGEQAWAPQSST
jgi:hypothetical protein